MIIQGPLKSGKTSFILEELISLVKSGISTSQILVLTSNGYQKKLFTDRLRTELVETGIEAIGVMPVYTFNGIVYNSILNNWPQVEELIKDDIGKREIIPDLSGLEITQWLLKECIDKTDFCGYMSKFNLYHQLLRRYKLATDNSLNDSEIEKKSKILNEDFAYSAKVALNRLKAETTKLRSFDNIKQTNTFLHLLNSNKLKDFDNIKYVFVDDIDEMPYCAQFFIDKLKKQAEKYYITIDKDGGSRRGYLGANPDIWDEFKNDSDIKELSCKKDIYSSATSLFNNIKNVEDNENDSIDGTSTINRTEMISEVLKRLQLLFNDDIEPNQICIVAPILDENIKHNLSEYFRSKGLEYQFLTGSKKLYDDPIVNGCITIAQLINEDWHLKPSVYDLRVVLSRILNIPVVSCKEILEKYKKSGKNLVPKDIELDEKDYTNRYNALINAVDELKENPKDLYTQLVEIFKSLVLPLIDEDIDLMPFNSILKSLDEFLTIAQKKGREGSEKEWMLMIRNQVVSDNPISAPEINNNAILVSTPQKLIDYEIEKDYHLWLDVSDRNWVKEDIGPLYNAWVFSKNWNNKEYNTDICAELTRQKTAHVIRKLMMLANQKVFAFYSELDATGAETNGYLHRFINPKECKNENQFKQIIPREDQKPVLAYKSGIMAVPAVPGAGKTTIMQALIIELLKRDIKPFEILVLTYMESAAKNFLDRIKKSCQGLKDLPHISTIHGLAYKIIQDEDNYVNLGLNADFSICDDITRPKIIRDICEKYLPYGEDGVKWSEFNAVAVSKAKISRLSVKKIEEYVANNENQQLEEFLPVYRDYEQSLRDRNLLDYDDLLVMATKLLKDHKHIRQYYQNIFKYVIEDEAQDSSSIQQEFISILSDKSGNLIRCGDVNQAITTTFSNADVRGFKDFIANNNQVEMQSSQRCAKDVYELANYLIDYSKEIEYTKNAFYDIKMQPVKGGNPQAKDSLSFRILENNQLEKQWVLSQIKDRIEKNPDETFGILLRTNRQVFDWASMLDRSGIKTLCRTDTLKQKKVFTLILKMLEVIESPWDNKLIAGLYEEFNKSKIIRGSDETTEFIRSELGTPFITYTVGSEKIQQLETQELVEFWWDIHYWIENSHIPVEELVTRIGAYYFNNVLDRSNANLLAILVKKFTNNFDREIPVKLPEIIAHFKQLQNKNRISGVKFFTEEDKDDSLGGYVQVMTMHKAKGDEFETVFIPEMHENEFSYAITPENIKVKDENILYEKIRELAGLKKKTKQEIITEQIVETLRLIYVAITRAEKHLYMTSSYKRITRYGKLYDVEPSTLLEHFIDRQEKLKGVGVNG